MADLGKKFLNTIKKSDERKTQPFDAVGTVKRVKDGVAYVHFAGGVDETPVKLTINAQAGDEVQVRVADGRAWLMGNATRPPTDDAQARRAINLGKQANDAAVKATKDAMVAHEAAESATRDAKTAKDLAESVEGIAEQARTDAGIAKSAADKAVKDLSQVENVVGVVNWIAEHGEMISQAGGTFEPAKVYFIVDPNGDYHIGNTHYSVVAEPKAEDIDDYYILNIDESVQNYVMTHLFVDDEGLWLIPEENATVQTSSKKILIATGGQGHDYPVAGTYIIEKVNGTDNAIAKFTSSGIELGKPSKGSFMVDDDECSFYTYYDSVRSLSGTIGNDNIAMTGAFTEDNIRKGRYCAAFNGGILEYNNEEIPSRVTYGFASGICAASKGMASHAEGYNNGHMREDPEYHVLRAKGIGSHVEGFVNDSVSHIVLDNLKNQGYGKSKIIASGVGSHAEGCVQGMPEPNYTPSAQDFVAIEADGSGSHAGGYITTSAAVTKQIRASGKGAYAQGAVDGGNSVSIIAQGKGSHAEGYARDNNIEANGDASHAEGCGTIAQGFASHAEGQDTQAWGIASHASGIGTIAVQGLPAQHAIGTYNKIDSGLEHLFIVGNGTANNARSNAFTVGLDGNVKAQGWAGFIQMFAGATAPNGWLFCDGSEVAVDDYPLLYAVIGDTYGTPSDSDHFILPDFMGRTPIGVGQGTGLTNRDLGDQVGAEEHTLTVNQMPQHNHQPYGGSKFMETNDNIMVNSTARSYPSQATGGTHFVISNTYNGISEYENTRMRGGNEAHPIMQPSLGINFIICTGETS